MRLSKVKTGVIVAIASIFCLATLLTAFLFSPNGIVNAAPDPVGAWISVPQLWDSESKSFNQTNLNQLLSYISSDGTIDGVNTNRQTAADIRGYTYGGKYADQYIKVTIGDYDWIVVYLTRTNDTTGARIATLLMVNNDGEASITPGGYDNGNNWTGAYPSNMYGASYMRAVTLNNGGIYANITANNNNSYSTASATQSASHKYALYTVASQGLTNYLVQPKNVWYQTQAQLTGSANPTGYTLNNESLSTTISTGWYNNNASTYSYQTKTNYTQWGSDYLWLPSLSETGTDDSRLGIWELSTTERSASDNWWSRSGYLNNSYNAYCLPSSGSSYYSYYVSSSGGVRPALHLNLDKMLGMSIRAESSNTNQGTVSGGGEFDVDYSGTTTITATANAGYIFDYWQDSSGNKIYENPYTFPVTKSETYTAYFRLPQVTFTTSNSGAEIAINNTTTDDIVRRHQLDFTANNYLDSVSINGGPPQDIEYLSGTLVVDDSCLGITYLTNSSASRVLFEISGVVDDVEITLYFTNIEQTLTPPSASGGASGIVVSATLGGVASIVGDDFEGLGDNDTITFIARLSQNGYRFSHWEDGEGNNLGTTDNLVLTKAEAYNKKIIAVFVPLDQSNANFDTNNDDTQEFY